MFCALLFAGPFALAAPPRTDAGAGKTGPGKPDTGKTDTGKTDLAPRHAPDRPASSAARIGAATASVLKQRSGGGLASSTDEEDEGAEDDDAPGGRGKTGAGPAAEAPDSWPTAYVDLETGWSSTPGNTLAFGLRNLRTLNGAKSRGLYLSAPLTIDLSERLSIYAGVDGSASQTLGQKWGQFTPGAWTVGGSAEVVSQSDSFPAVSLSASVSRPFEATALGAHTTTWTLGVDLDYQLDSGGSRGLVGGLDYSRVQISSPFARVGPQLDGYIGAYWSPAPQVTLTTQLGVQYFGGAELAAVLRLKPATTPYVQLELEHVDSDDDRIFAVNLMLGWSPKPMLQLSLSTPLYIAR